VPVPHLAVRDRSMRPYHLAVLLALLLVPGPLLASNIQSVHGQSVESWNPNVSCAASTTTFLNVTGPSGGIATPWQTSSTTGGVPNKRALSPPCTITNVNGKVVSTLVQINGIYLPHLIYGDCSTSYNSVNGGGPYPDRNSDGKADTFCDDYGDIHSVAGGSTSIHIEFDQDWMAKGYCGPGHSPCDNNTITQSFSSGSISLDVQGFVYWDAGHWELHPFTAWKLSSSPPPGPQPFATSFTYSPSSPSPGIPVSFTGTATGGVSPYTFTWDFGDSGAAIGNTVSHAYSSGGNYTVTLKSVDSNNTTVKSSQILNVKTQTTYTFTPTDDTYVEQDTPTTNYGTSTEITVDSSPVKQILLKFNVQISGQVTGATLRLFQVDSSDRGGDFHTTNASWTENTATWNNAPPANPTIFFSLGPVTTNLWYNITMGSVVTGSGIVSLRVTSSSPTGDGSHFASKERSGGANAPQLIVTTAISSTNSPPALSVPSAQTVNEQTPLSFTVSASDDASQTITLSAQGLPSGAVFTSSPGTGSVTGTFTWTPTEAQGPGTYSITFKATDNLGAVSTGNVSITVSEVNRPPTVNLPGSQTVAVGTTLTFTATATDPDIPPNTVTLSASGLVAGMSFNSSTGLFSFTPIPSQLAMTFTVNFTAADNGLPPMSNMGTVTISVSVTPPSLNVPASQTVNEQTLLGFTVNATDSPTRTITLSCGNCASLEATFNSSPSKGTVTGGFAWTPTEPQGPGTYTFSITASNDLGGSTTKNIVVTVNEVNLPPTLTVPGSQTVDELTQLAFTISATDPDIPANAVTLACTTCPSIGASFNPSTGVFSWIPTEAQGPGTYTVTFTATDNGSPSLSDMKQVIITVNEVNAPPVVSAPATITVTVNSTITLQVSATDNNDIPSNSIILNATGLVQGMSFPAVTGNPVSGTFSFTPTQAQKGTTFTVTFIATDNGVPVLSSSKTMTITVAVSQSYALAISNDGRVFRYQNGTFTLIGQPVTTALRSVAWKPDGSYALISGDSAVLLKYDGTQLTRIPTSISSGFNFWTVAWKPDGSYALVGGTSGLLFRYDGNSITTVNNSFSSTILSISWNPSGSYALMVGRSGLALTYDGSTIRSLSSGVSGDLDTAAWTPNGQYALIGGANGVVLKYNGTQISPVNTSGLTGTNMVRSITFNPSGSLAILAGDNGLILTFNGTLLTLIPAVSGNFLYSISWSGSTAYIVGGTGAILSYSAGVLKNLTTNTTASFRAIAWKPI
jgi:PKD repeat protein